MSGVFVGQTLSLRIDQPAVGGWMIGRAGGQVILIDGAIPGEHVSARIDRVGRGVAFATTVSVDEPSADRREFPDRTCGGCLYAHIAYERQLDIKSVVILDAFARTGRLDLPAKPTIRPSLAQGYRMRARLHRRGRRLGFFREGTHEICNARATGQLLSDTCRVIEELEAALDDPAADTVREVEVSENVNATERVLHLDAGPGLEDRRLDRVSSAPGVSGVTAGGAAEGARVLSGSPFVTDVFEVHGRTPVTVRRHVSAFFQGNRFLLRDLVTHVVEQVPDGSRVTDLYAGGGLFALAVARARDARVVAVEGDRASASDLVANAAAADAAVTPVHQSVEAFVESARLDTDLVIVDPPRTGLSREALQGVIRMRSARILYVSCDVATLARDARRLADAGYAITSAEGFDMFPNTPHVEMVVVFEEGSKGARSGK